MVAIGLSQLGPFFAIAGFGLIAAVLSRRAFTVSLVFELICLAAAGAVITSFEAVPKETVEWFYAGAAFIVMARAATLAVIRHDRRNQTLSVGKKLDL